MKAIPSIKLLAIQLGVPSVLMALYTVWAGALMARDIGMAKQMGVVVPSRGLLPSWGYIEAVGTLGPWMVMILLTPHIWRRAAGPQIPSWLRAVSGLALGASWAWLLWG